MRKFLFFWILLISADYLMGQFQHFAEHRRWDQITGMICINQKSFYLERIDAPNYDNLNLVGIDQGGMPYLKKRLLPTSSNYSLTNSRLLNTLDDHLVCTYRAMLSCDVGGPNLYYFSKLDTNGNFVFTTTLSLLPNGIVQYSDSSYYLVDGSGGMKHYSQNGTFISSYGLSGNGFGYISRLNNGNLFVSGPALYGEVTTSGNFIQSIPTNTVLTKFIQLSSGNSYGLSQSGVILRFSSNFSVVNQSQLTGVVISDFIGRNDSIFACGYYSANTKPFYGILNNALQSLFQTSNTLTAVTPVSIGLSKNNLINISGRAAGISPNFSRVFFRFPLGGDFAAPHDIGVSDFTAINVAQMNDYYYSAELEIEVRNYGNTSVKGFNLNADLNFMICPQSWQKWYDTIIPPAGVVKVLTGTFILAGVKTNQMVNFCFFTSTPNQQIDHEVSNDNFCKSVSYSPLGSSEYKISENNIRLFPNPFSSSVKIQSEFEIKEIELYNSIGVSIQKLKLGAKSTEIETEDLPKGIYFVRIETEKGILTKKLAKE